MRRVIKKKAVVTAKKKVALSQRERVKRLFNDIPSGKSQLTVKSSSIVPKQQFSFIWATVERQDKKYTVKFIITVNQSIDALCEVKGPGIEWSHLPEKGNLWEEISNKAKAIANQFIRTHQYGDWELESFYRIKINGSHDLSKLYKGPLQNGFGRTIDPKNIMEGSNIYSHKGKASDDLAKVHEYLYYFHLHERKKNTNKNNDQDKS